MADFGNFVIYLIMMGAVIGACASVLKPESGLGREFVNGIHSIGPVFLAQAGIMISIPFLSKFIEMALGPYFSLMGSDVSIAALSIIAVDMGGYQLADAIAANRDVWITAMIVGYTSGATIVYLIPVGLMMLDRKDHRYLALGAMAGLISIPFAVLASLVMITTFNLPVREMVSTNSPALHYLTLDFVACLKLLAPLFIFCFVLAAGLRYKANLMVTGFLVFGKVMDAFIKIILALAIVEHFTGFFMKNFGVWGFDLMFANIIAVYHMFKNLNARDKVLCVALGVCAQATIGDHLAFTANFQPTLIMPVLLAKLFGGLLAAGIAIKISVPAALRYEAQERTQQAELDCPQTALRCA